MEITYKLGLNVATSKLASWHWEMDDSIQQGDHQNLKSMKNDNYIILHENNFLPMKLHPKPICISISEQPHYLLTLYYMLHRIKNW